MAVDEQEQGTVSSPVEDEQILRLAAELDNVRRRAKRDVASAEGRGIAKLARQMLPALDDVARALAAVGEQPNDHDEHLAHALRLVQKDLIAALAQVGVEAESPLGEQFDPHKHEAVAMTPVEGSEPGTIVEVYAVGYLHQESVLRAAKVVVAG